MVPLVLTHSRLNMCKQLLLQPPFGSFLLKLSPVAVGTNSKMKKNRRATGQLSQGDRHGSNKFRPPLSCGSCLPSAQFGARSSSPVSPVLNSKPLRIALQIQTLRKTWTGTMYISRWHTTWKLANELVRLSHKPETRRAVR